MKVKRLTLVFLCSILLSCTPEKEKKVTNTQTEEQMVELAPFFLKEGVSEQMLLDASAAVQEGFITEQPGFIKRELVKKSEREYLDIVYWDSQKNAEKAAKKAMSNPVCLAFFSLMEEADPNDPNNGLSHYKLLHTYR